MTNPWVRRAALGLAAARTAIGVTALAEPAFIARPWVGSAAEGATGRVFGRALGGRDLALGLGTLAALQRPPVTGQQSAARWVGAGALADSLDVLATAAAWDELPVVTRWLVAGSAAGAAAIGALAAWSLVTTEPGAAGPLE